MISCFTDVLASSQHDENMNMMAKLHLSEAKINDTMIDHLSMGPLLPNVRYLQDNRDSLSQNQTSQ
jgi:hypothetical protein